ncbi:MAG: DUF3322 domain-containing protein [Bacteroidota bacterium]
MITPTEIRKKAKNKYPEILRALVTDEVVFPWLVPSNKTLPKELSAYMQALETLLTKSKNRTGAGYIVELETKQTRSLGSQSVPREIRFDSAEDYLNFLNKAKEASDYIGRVSTLTAFSPKLGEWAIQYPKKVIAAEALEHDQPVWEGILAVLSWFLEDYEADTFYNWSHDGTPQACVHPRKRDYLPHLPGRAPGLGSLWLRQGCESLARSGVAGTN